MPKKLFCPKNGQKKIEMFQKRQKKIIRSKIATQKNQNDQKIQNISKVPKNSSLSKILKNGKNWIKKFKTSEKWQKNPSVSKIGNKIEMSQKSQKILVSLNLPKKIQNFFKIAKILIKKIEMSQKCQKKFRMSLKLPKILLKKNQNIWKVPKNLPKIQNIS